MADQSSDNTSDKQPDAAIELKQPPAKNQGLREPVACSTTTSGGMGRPEKCDSVKFQRSGR